LEGIARIDNQRLIALRETKVIDAERKLQMAAIKLSLFLRTPDGQPLVVDSSDTLQVAAVHPLLDLLGAILGQSQQLPIRVQRLSHRHPVPVDLRAFADELQQLRLDRWFDGLPRQRCL